MSVFVNQGLLEIIIDTKTDISTASLLRIDYKKPTGIKGSFAGTLEGTTKIKYQCTNSDLNVIGLWQFQAYVVIGSLTATGNIVTQEVSRNV